MKYHSCPKCDHRFRRAIYDKNGLLLKGVCGFCGFVYDKNIKEAYFTTKELIK